MVKEQLNEDLNFKPVNLKEEVIYYSDMKDSIEGDEAYKYDFTAAFADFGIDEENVGVISSYGAEADWEDIKEELDKLGLQYYEFDLYDGESAILVDVTELDEEEI